MVFTVEILLYLASALLTLGFLGRTLYAYAGEFSFLKQRPAGWDELAVQWLFLAPFLLISAALLYTGGHLSYGMDWLVYYNYHFIPAESMRQGELMHWTTTLSGGFPFAGHPENPGVTPLMLPVLLFGEVVGLKINIVLIYLMLVLGSFLLARRHLGFSIRGSALLSCLLLVSTVVAARVVTAKYTNLFELLIPLILFLFLESLHHQESRQRLMAAGSCAILLAVVLFQGKIGLVNTSLFLFGIFVGVLFRAEASRKKRIFWTALGMGVLFLLLAAPKILPMLDLLRIDARYVESFERLRNHILVPRTLFMALITYQYDEVGWIFNNQLIGLGALPLLVAGYAVIRDFRQSRMWLALLVIFCLIVMGDNAPIPIGYWLWHLPLFHSMEDLDRYYTFFIMFTIAVLAVQGVELVARHPRRGAGATWALVAVMVAPLLFHSFGLHLNAFLGTPIQPEASPEFHFVEKSRDPSQGVMLGQDYLYALRGIGVINGYTNLRYPSGTQARYRLSQDGTERPNPAYQGEVYLEGGEGQARIVGRMENGLRLEVTAQTPATVVVNQSASPYWQLSSGSLVADESRLLKIRLEQKGTFTIEARNVNPWFRLGCWLALAGVFLLSMVMVMPGRRA